MPVLPDQLRLLVADRPEEIAYRVVGAGELTFGEWDALASRVAHGLLDRGVRVGDRVGLVFEGVDALEFMTVYTGVHKAGAVAVPLSPRLAAGELATLVAHSEPALVVVGGSVRAGALPAGAPVTAYDELLSDDDRDVQAPVDEDSPADIVYTSGTTGTPKGVLVRHRTAAQLPIDAPSWVGQWWLSASPLSTTAGLSFVYLPMRLGMRGLYLPRFDAGAFLDLAEAGQVSLAFLVPAMVTQILARDDLARRDLSGVSMITVGSAPSAAADLLRLDALLPCGLVANGFSLTESGGTQVVITGEDLRRRPGSVGRPLPPAQVRVVDPAGRPLPPGAVGEVLLANPGREREYFRDPAATAATWRDGWLHTGDLGRLDEDGFLYLTGRAKDVIVRGGSNVHAADVEAVLLAHPAVAEAAVVGVAHATLGEEVVAYVVPTGELDPAALVAFCAERLASYKVPREVRLVTALPRNEAGKVLKRALRGR